MKKKNRLGMLACLPLIAVLFLSCKSVEWIPVMPTGIIIPTVTITPVPSSTPEILPTPTTGALQNIGRALPTSGSPITVENIKRAQLLAVQGNGIPLDMVLSYDGTFGVLGTTRGLFIFDVFTLAMIQQIELQSPQIRVCVSHDNRQIASAGEDGKVSILQVESGLIIRQIDNGQKGFVSAMAFSPDGSTLVTTDTRRLTHIWSLVDGKEEGVINANARIIHHLSFSERNDRLYSWAPAEPVKVWNLNNRQLNREISISPDELGKSAVNGSFSMDGAFFAANSGLRVRIYRLDTGYTLQLIRLDEPARYVVLSPDGGRLWVVGDEKAWLYETGSKDSPLEYSLPPGFPGQERVQFRFDSGSLVLASSSLKAWDLEKDKVSGQPVDVFASNFVLDTVFLETQQQIKQLMMDGRMNVLSFQGSLLETVSLGNRTLLSGAISKDGVWAAASNIAGETILWSADGKEEKYLSNDGCRALAFSENGLLACAAEKKKVIIWEVPDGYIKYEIITDSLPQELSLAPDGKTLVVRTTDGVSAWDLSAPMAKNLNRLEGDAVALSPDGQLMAVSESGLKGRWISVYNTSDQKEMMKIKASAHWMAFSADHSLLFLAGDPLTVWDVKSGRQLQAFQNDGSLGPLALTVSDSLLALIKWDGTLKLWGIY